MSDDSTTDQRLPVTRRQFLGASSVTTLAGCFGIEFAADPETLEITLAHPPLTLDPFHATDMGSVQIINQVVESLYAYRADLTLEPVLAADTPTPSRDGHRYVVPIDTDARFPGDVPVTASDVVHSYTTPQTEEAPASDAVDMIDDVTAIDDRTVQFDLSIPYQPFRTVLTAPVIPHPDSDAAATQPADGDADRLVGSGPFTFDSRMEDGGIRLQRWDRYWRDPVPAVDAVEFRAVPDGTKRVVTIKASETDVIDDIPPLVWDTLDDLDTVTVTATPGLGYYHLGFNCQAGPTADPHVREAIDYAVDLDTIIAEQVGPIGDRIYAPIPHQVSAAWTFPTEEWASIPHDRDIDEAATLLDSSSAVPPDWEARIIVPPDDTRETICEAIADGIRATGYEARVDRLDWSTFADTYTSGDPEAYHAYSLGWIDAPHPDHYLHPLFGPNAPGRTDGTYYTTVAETVQSARETPAESGSRLQYIDAIETLLTDRAHLPLYTLQRTVGTVDRVTNMGPDPLDGFVLVGDGYNVTLTTD